MHCSTQREPKGFANSNVKQEMQSALRRPWQLKRQILSNCKILSLCVSVCLFHCSYSLQRTECGSNFAIWTTGICALVDSSVSANLEEWRISLASHPEVSTGLLPIQRCGLRFYQIATVILRADLAGCQKLCDRDSGVQFHDICIEAVQTGSRTLRGSVARPEALHRGSLRM